MTVSMMAMDVGFIGLRSSLFRRREGGAVGLAWRFAASRAVT